MTPPIAVVGLGLACPVGWRSSSALAAMRAGITRFTEVGELVGPGGPVRASMLASLDPDAPRTARATAFARAAAHEAVADLVDPGERPLPCFLALPGPGPGPRLDLDLLHRDLTDLAPGAPRLDLRYTTETGRAGIFAALHAATQLLHGAERLALIGGLDSLADPQTLADLADRDRLLGRSNLDGVLPGEGAAFLLLARPGPPRRALAHVLTTTLADEPIPFARAGDRLSASDGLTAAFKKIRDEHPDRVDEIFAGTTGEAYFGRELSHAYLRNVALMPEPMRCTSPYSALGDTGAAAGAIALVQAITSLTTHRTVLAYASSDTGPVGATLLTRP